MAIKYRRTPPVAGVPTASMADIAFLLIIFFMLTTSFSPERTNVSLPESSIRTEVSKEAAIVAITDQGEVHFSDGEVESRPLSLAELKAEVGYLIDAAPNKQFVIKADRLARYETVDEVLETLRGSGARDIGFLTRRRAQALIAQ